MEKSSSFGFLLCQCGHIEPIPGLFGHYYQELLEFGLGICPNTSFRTAPSGSCKNRTKCQKILIPKFFERGHYN